MIFNLINLTFEISHDVVKGSPLRGNQHEAHISLKVTSTWQHVCYDMATTDELTLIFGLKTISKGSNG